VVVGEQAGADIQLKASWHTSPVTKIAACE
jgi:hypothetical protein